jgi:hypothetical protein
MINVQRRRNFEIMISNMNDCRPDTYCITRVVWQGGKRS